MLNTILYSNKKTRIFRLNLKWGMLEILILLTLSILSNLSTASSNELFSKPDIRQHFSSLLPTHWNLEQFEIDKTIEHPKGNELIIKQRFTAILVLKEDSFVFEKEDHGIESYVKVGEKGEKRTVYGLSTLISVDKSWKIQFGLENDPTTGLGKPKSALGNKVVIRGTKRARGNQEELSQARLAAFKTEAREKLIREFFPDWVRLRTFNFTDKLMPGLLIDSNEEKTEIRFNAIIEFLSDTFIAVNKRDISTAQTTLLRQVSKVNERRHIYGRLIVYEVEGSRSLQIECENDLPAHLGEPKDRFQGRILKGVGDNNGAGKLLVEGSTEERKYKQEMQDLELQKLQRKLEILKSNYNVKSSRMAFNARMEEKQELILIQKIKREFELADENAKNGAREK